MGNIPKRRDLRLSTISSAIHHRQMPNALTVVRLFAIPVVVVALLDETSTGRYVAAAVFAFAVLTDYVDGMLARRRNSVSAFGKLADPIADKLLIIAALLSLISVERALAWAVALIIARELIVTAMRLLALKRGMVLAANAGGKAKTVLQSAAVFALILSSPEATWALVLLYVALAVTLVSGAAYLLDFWRSRPGPQAGA